VKRPKVLVVDDDPGMREVLESILLTENVEICSAVDGKDAVQKMLTLNPDLILLDVGMPKLNGLTFCKAVRAGTQTRNVPIIIVTSLTARAASKNAWRLVPMILWVNRLRWKNC